MAGAVPGVRAVLSHGDHARLAKIPVNSFYDSAVFASDQRHAAAIEPKRHFEYFAPRLPNHMVSAAFGFGMSVCLLAASAAGMRSGIIGFLALTAAIVVLFPHAVVRANVRNAVIWLYPAWALFSTQWSINPDRTVHQVLLLLPTIASGIALGGMPHRRSVGAGAALAFAAYMAYSVAYGASVLFSDTGRGGSALSGITNGKNYFGHLAAMSLLVAPMLLTVARGRFVGPVIALTGAIMAVSGFALVQSHATGSMLSTVLAFIVMVAVLIFQRFSWQFRIVLVAAILGILVLYVLFGEQLQEQLFATILKTFNKDTSLTGRTVLWDHADRLIAEHRMLGYGYGAFWFYTNPEAWTIWRMMGVQPMSGFNFHNTLRDTLIELGWVGLAMYVVGFGYPLLRTISRALVRNDLISAVGVAFMTYFIVRMPVESTGIGAVTVDTLLLIVFLCSTVTEEKGDGIPESGNRFRTAPRRPVRERRHADPPPRPRVSPSSLRG